MQYRRFGRTNLKIPILTLGGMRFQKSWDQLDFSEVSYQEQNKVENILNLANKYGLSHIETAKYYGTSEVQLGMGFQNTQKMIDCMMNGGIFIVDIFQNNESFFTFFIQAFEKIILFGIPFRKINQRTT